MKGNPLLHTIVALVTSLGISTTALSQPLAAAEYARLPESNEVLLSPDGKQVAVWSNYFSEIGNSVQINLINRVDGSATAAITRHVDDYEMMDVVWLDNERLLMEYFHPDTFFYRHEILNISDNSRREIDFGVIIDPVIQDPKYLLAALSKNDFGLYRLGVHERSLLQLEENQETTWIADTAGEPRIRINYEDNIEVDYIAVGESRYDRLATFDALGANYLWPLGFAADGNIFYAYKEHEDKRSLFRVNMASGSAAPELVIHDPRRNLQGSLLKDIATGEALGYNLEGDRATALWSATYATLLEQLKPLLPGSTLRLTQVNSATGDYVVLATAADNRGTWLLGNTRNGSIQPLLPRNPAVASAAPVRVETRWISAPEGDIEALVYSPAAAEAANLPTVILAGLGSGFEDRYAFDSLAQLLVSRGMAVVAVDIGGVNSRRTNFLRSVDADWWSLERIYEGTTEEWGPEFVGRTVAALNWAVSQGIADENRVCLMGTEIGASTVLVAANQLGDQIQCAVAITPYVKYSDLVLEMRHLLNDTLFNEPTDSRVDLAELKEKEHYLANLEWFRVRRFFSERNAMLTANSPNGNYENIQANLLITHDAKSPEIYRGGGEVGAYLDKLDEAGVGYEYFDVENGYLQGYSYSARKPRSGYPGGLVSVCRLSRLSRYQAPLRSAWYREHGSFFWRQVSSIKLAQKRRLESRLFIWVLSAVLQCQVPKYFLSAA